MIFQRILIMTICRFGVGSGWLGVMIKCEVIRRHSRIFWTKLHSWSSLSYCIFFITQFGGSEPGGQSNPIQLVKLQEFSLCQLIILRAWKQKMIIFEIYAIWLVVHSLCGSIIYTVASDRSVQVGTIGSSVTASSVPGSPVVSYRSVQLSAVATGVNHNLNRKFYQLFQYRLQGANIFTVIISSVMHVL